VENSIVFSFFIIGLAMLRIKKYGIFLTEFFRQGLKYTLFY